MSFFRLLCALVAVTIAAADVPSVPIPSLDETVADAVSEITYSEISRVYQGEWLLIVYAPWCGHCHRLMDNMPTIVESLQGHVKIVKIDGTEYDAVRFQFGVDGYPSIYRLHDGEVRTYNGTYTPEDIADFALVQWATVPPLSGWNSPTSFFIRTASRYINLITPVVTITENAGKRFDMAPEVIIILATSLIVVVAVIIAYISVRRINARKRPPLGFLCDPAKIKEN